MSLTPKQARFVEEYFVDLNATQAAIRAGYSAKTAYSQGERLLRNVEVAAAPSGCLRMRSITTQPKGLFSASSSDSDSATISPASIMGAGPSLLFPASAAHPL